MDAVWIRFRAEVRQRWRALVALVLLAGIPGGIAIAAASGAARTDSVIDRLAARTRPPLIYLPTYFQETKLAFDDVAQLPVVSEAFVFHGYGGTAGGKGNIEIGAPVGTALGPERTHLLEGRVPRSDRADEATINYKAEQVHHWKVGDVLDVSLAGRGSSFFGGESVPGPTVRTTIVGITADVGDFVGIAEPGLSYGTAFSRMYDQQLESADLFVFSLKRGGEDVQAFNDALFKLTGGNGLIYVDGRSGLNQIRRVFRLNGAALWVLGVAVSLVSALIFAQASARQALLQSSEDRSLFALGMTRPDLVRIAVARAGTIAAGAAALAAVIAAALSPIFPLGTPHFAEPSPGLSLPAATFGVGVGSLAILVFAIAVVSGYLATRAAVDSRADRPAQPSAVVRLMRVLTRRPAPTVGARFALEPGRGTTAVPVRTSLTAIVTGIVALVAALTAGASMRHLLNSPALYGWNWDHAVPGDFSTGSQDLKDLVADPAVAAASVGTGGQGLPFRIDYRSWTASTNGITVDRVKGHLGPKLLAGRVPTGVNEIALGPKTLEALRARIGSEVRVGVIGKPRSASLPRTVVGELVLPFDDDVTGIGEGLWATYEAVHPLDEKIPREAALIRFAPGVDQVAAAARLSKRFPSEEEEFNQFTPRTIQSMQRMAGLAVALAVMLALLAAGTLAHMLTTSIRRRRRDLAILRTMGFSSGQVRSAVGWQAIVFVAVGLAIAIPLGIVVGRWTWRVIARYAGFAAVPIVPALQIVIVIVSALAAAILLAALPARSAARTRPALVLRTE
ncbi:MAG: FtsX-like permease family protein [Actinomycetota bacterium]